MGRLFSVVFLMLALLAGGRHLRAAQAQPVFFSMLFPQLAWPGLTERPEQALGEAVAL